MRVDLDQYPLYMVAREFGDKPHICKEHLLCLLMEGKLIAHASDDYFRIDIPSSYWRSVTLERFCIFGKRSFEGNEYYIEKNTFIIEAYRSSMESFDDAVKYNDIDRIPKRLLSEISHALHITKDHTSVDCYHEKSITDEVNMVNDESESAKFDDILYAKKPIISAFIKSKTKLQAYISAGSWRDYCGAYRPRDPSINKGGRPENVHWKGVLLYLLMCISKSQNKKLHELVGVPTLNHDKLVAALYNWIRREECSDETPNLKYNSIKSEVSRIYNRSRNERDIEYYLNLGKRDTGKRMD